VREQAPKEIHKVADRKVAMTTSTAIGVLHFRDLFSDVSYNNSLVSVNRFGYIK
jgi:hypothetical protein